MLVTFYSDAHENVTFFGEVAKQLLQCIGHGGTIPGALLPEQLPEAIANLKTAIAFDRSTAFPTEEDEPIIGFKQRALPLLLLLENAAAANCPVLWREES